MPVKLWLYILVIGGGGILLIGAKSLLHLKGLLELVRLRYNSPDLRFLELLLTVSDPPLKFILP